MLMETKHMVLQSLLILHSQEMIPGRVWLRIQISSVQNVLIVSSLQLDQNKGD